MCAAGARMMLSSPCPLKIDSSHIPAEWCRHSVCCIECVAPCWQLGCPSIYPSTNITAASPAPRASRIVSRVKKIPTSKNVNFCIRGLLLFRPNPIHIYTFAQRITKQVPSTLDESMMPECKGCLPVKALELPIAVPLCCIQELHDERVLLPLFGKSHLDLANPRQD